MCTDYPYSNLETQIYVLTKPPAQFHISITNDYHVTTKNQIITTIVYLNGMFMTAINEEIKYTSIHEDVLYYFIQAYIRTCCTKLYEPNT